MKKFEHWIWAELLAFDNTKPDGGAEAYLELLGFVPEGISLFLVSPDFIFRHDMSAEHEMPPGVCARNGHPGNEYRSRQAWTNFQLRTLVRSLTAHGCEVYASVFAGYPGWGGHPERHEWLAEHPEATRLNWECKPFGSFNPIGTLADGVKIEDIFLPAVVEVCQDYGFAGWHACDGYASLLGLTHGALSDPMTDEFFQESGIQYPEPMRRFGNSREALIACGRWLWEKHRAEWTEFHVRRWTGFYAKAIALLHAAGKKIYMNSVHTKAGFDTWMLFGFDYRSVFALGVDGMICETMALSLSLDPLGAKRKIKSHDNYALMLQEIKTIAPSCKMIFLSGVKDLIEDWDVLRQAPTGYERELTKLAHCYYQDSAGFAPAADGLMVCLGDGIARHEWALLQRFWAAATHRSAPAPMTVCALFDDRMMEDAARDDYHQDGMPPNIDQLTLLLEAGVPIQTTGAYREAAAFQGALCLPSAHLFAPDELEKLLAGRDAPVILCGRRAALEAWRGRGEIISDRHFAIGIFAPGVTPADYEMPDGAPVPANHDAIIGFMMPRLEIPPATIALAAQRIQLALRAYCTRCGLPFAECQDPENEATLIQSISGDDPGALIVGLENRANWGNLRKTVVCNRPIAEVTVLSRFPLRVTMQDEHRFSVLIPVRGISVCKIRFKEDCR